jgi:hypothetical protein
MKMKNPFVRPTLEEEAPLAEATLFFMVQNAELLSNSTGTDTLIEL